MHHTQDASLLFQTNIKVSGAVILTTQSARSNYSSSQVLFLNHNIEQQKKTAGPICRPPSTAPKTCLYVEDVPVWPGVIFSHDVAPGAES